jgi:hypothetical protein
MSDVPIRPELQAIADLARRASPHVVDVTYRANETAGLLVVELRDASPSELCAVHEALRDRCRALGLSPSDSFVLVNASGRPTGPARIPDAWPPDSSPVSY